jgi:hypothetical protein
MDMTRPLRRLWVRWRRARGDEAAARRVVRAEPDPADQGTTLGLEISVAPRAPASRPARRRAF